MSESDDEIEEDLLIDIPESWIIAAKILPKPIQFQVIEIDTTTATLR